VGSPPLSIPTALLFFNVGVEIGQLIFIPSVLAVIAACRWIARGLKVSLPPWLWRGPPYAIGGIASFWIVQRVSAFWVGLPSWRKKVRFPPLPTSA
jgi:hypothetical protein